MDTLAFCFVAGFLGSLTGLGGGVLIVPWLTLVMDVPATQAIGVSLMAVIATSLGASVKNHSSVDPKLVILLACASVPMAFIGSFSVFLLKPTWLFIAFAFILVLLMTMQFFRVPQPPKQYRATLGLSLMGFAGLVSGLFGIGAGAFKVVSFEHVYALEPKAAAAHSNSLIGITAASSVAIFLAKGLVNPVVAVNVALGTLLGSFIAATYFSGVNVKVIRFLFISMVLFSALQMFLKGLHA